MDAGVRGDSGHSAGLAPSAGSPQMDLSQRSRRGRPPTMAAIKKLVIAMARENPGWGHRRIQAEFARLGHKIAHSTVWEILKMAGIDPGPRHSGSDLE